jgi:cytochrome c556
VARLFREQFTEMLRPGLATSEDPDFIHALRVAETAAIDLERAIAAADPAAADRAWKVVRENCTSCHRRWRNSR